MAAPRRKKRHKSVPRGSRELARASMLLAERTRELRRDKKLTQQKAAEIAAIEVKHWQLIEAGESNPTLATLLAVAKALAIELHELLRIEPERRPLRRS